MKHIPPSALNYEALSALDASQILAKDIIANLRNITTRRIKRRTMQVKAEYDTGIWKSALEEKKWLHCGDVLEYINPQDEKMRVAKIENQLVHINTYDYYKFRLRFLQDLISQYAGDERELYELGCGVGLNIFSLALAGRWERLVGLDISENAVEAAQEAAEHFHRSDLHFGTLDLLNGDDANFKQLQGKVVFTYYCLEQLKYSTATVIRNIIDSGVKRVIHIEPTIELLQIWKAKDLVNYLYSVRMDYQNNLVTTLRTFEKQGRIKILDLKRLYYAPTWRHDPTFVCWEPIAPL
ncbi:MAG: methyltransferase [Pyrinomonadaceae bacterium]